MMSAGKESPNAAPEGVTVSRDHPQGGKNVSSDPLILVTGDAPDQLQQLCWMTKDCGYEPLEVAIGNGSVEAVRSRPAIVVVNFATIPSGRRRVWELREKYQKPVLCVLPCPDEQQIAQVAELTADALVFKPLRLDELASRLRILAWQNRPENTYPMVDRRCRGRRKEDREVAHRPGRARGSFLQISLRDKTVSCAGRPLKLTPKEYRLLSLLASDPGRVFSKQEIIARLWPDSRRATATDVQQYICLLRKKIEPDPSNPRLIKTVPAFGYRLECPDGI